MFRVGSESKNKDCADILLIIFFSINIIGIIIKNNNSYDTIPCFILCIHVAGICALPLRSARRGVPHFPVTGELLQNAGYGRAKHIQYSRNQKPLAQAERLPVLGRERLGDKSNLYVQHMSEPVSNGPS